MADSLLGEVYLSADIQQVNYGASETVISFSVGDGATIQQQSCGSTIIAFPPVPGDIDVFIPPEASLELQSLTSQIRTVNYYSILLADNDQFFNATGYSTPLQDRVPDNPAIILTYAKIYETPGTPVLGWYYSPSSKTEDEAKAEILQSYSTQTGKTMKEDVILAFQPWLNYFPHTSEQALKDGFYPNFDKLQGVSRQYYAGALFNFEQVQNAMEHGRYIVETYLA